MDAIELSRRFSDNIVFGSESECWLWTGDTSDSGYGKFRTYHEGKVTYHRAHRYAYEVWVGPIPEGHDVHHTCETRLCMNPGHLQPLTPQEHNKLHKTREVCLRGHAFTPENTYIKPNGTKRCRACTRIRDKKYRQRGR